MEGLAVDETLQRRPLSTIQRVGWGSILSGIALGVASTTTLNYAQRSEQKAERLLRGFDDESGSHPVFAQVQADYEDHLQRAANLRTAALAVGITAGVAFVAGLTFALVGAKRAKAAAPEQQPRLQGLRLRF